VTHGAGEPARLDGPRVLYEGDPPGGQIASADPRPGQTYRLGAGHNPTQGPNIIWLRATVSSEEPLSSPALLVNPDAEDCQVFVNGQKAVDCSNWPRTTDDARRWLLVHVPTGPAQIAIRIAGSMGSPARIPHHGDVLFGRAPVLEEIRTATDATRFYRVLPQTLLCAGELLGEVILLLAFRNDPRGRAYLWFAAFLFLDGTMSLESVFNYVYPLLPFSTSELTDALGLVGRYAPLVGFIAAFTGVRLNRWMRGYQILLLVIPVLYGLPFLSEKFAWLPRLSDKASQVTLLVVQVPFIVGSLGFLDMITISVSSTDINGHAFGPDDPSQKELIVQPDVALDALFTFLDKTIGLKNVMVAMTGDHGVATTEKAGDAMGMPVLDFSP
jgi:hypothetical protein